MAQEKQSLQGHLLIAAPKMSDPRFDRTVVLLLHHDDDGAMGVILNRPMKDHVRGPWQLLDVLASGNDRQIQIGGPMSGPLIVLRGQPDTSSGAQAGGVFVVEKREELEKLIQQIDDAPLQFFVGHAGWGGGQLEHEIEQGTWLTTPAAADFVFAEHEDMWVNAIRETGRAFYRDVLGIRDFPEDATVN